MTGCACNPLRGKRPPTASYFQCRSRAKLVPSPATPRKPLRPFAASGMLTATGNRSLLTTMNLRPAIARTSRTALGLAALCIGATYLGVGGAAAQFKAPSVSVYIPSGIGGGYDAYSRLVARHLSRFMPGNPVMVPKNMAGAGGVIAANYMYNVAPKDGSAIALFMAGAPFEPLFGNTQAKFDPVRFNWIMSLNRLVNIAIFWHESPVRTPEDFFKGQVLIGSSGGGDSSTEVYARLLNNLAGTKFKIVAGYTGNGEV